VFTTVSSEEKIQFVKSLRKGATHAINYRTQDFVEEIKRDTEGKGVSIVIDYIGQDYFKRNIDTLEIDGHLLILGLLSGTACSRILCVSFLHSS
jgi:NADPH:quinone reductase-like Zn-dependent oxidoreductase